MRLALTARQMKACDAYTIQSMGMPSLVLMERAALAVEALILERYPDAQKILVLCGSGNNGGDGFAVARLLLLQGRDVRVLFVGSHAHMTGESAAQERIYKAYGGEILPDEASVQGYDLIVDALFGIGLSRDIIARYADRVRAVNLSQIPVVAVDIPSGVNADDGHIMGCAIRAQVTVTFGFFKQGHLLYPGADYCGEVLVRDIGITDAALSLGFSQQKTKEKSTCVMEASDLAALLPKRSASANKGTYGRLLLIGGRKDMAGAMLLAGKSAYRTGCGLVCIASASENRQILQGGVPEAVFAPWEELSSWLKWADVVAIGPGLGQLPESLSALEKVLSDWSGPLVLDADALNLLAADKTLLEKVSQRIQPAVLTPHPGEMARLLKADGEERTAAKTAGAPLSIACDYAGRHSCITVLKGARTVVTDGEELWLNVLGNDGMATGGSGDVLTGIIGSLLAQGLDALEAARTGVLLHAMAGDAAAGELGVRSLTAGGIADSIPAVLKVIEEEKPC